MRTMPVYGAVMLAVAAFAVGFLCGFGRSVDVNREDRAQIREERADLQQQQEILERQLRIAGELRRSVEPSNN